MVQEGVLSCILCIIGLYLYCLCRLELSQFGSFLTCHILHFFLFLSFPWFDSRFSLPLAPQHLVIVCLCVCTLRGLSAVF